jgi:hypothetical protein
MNERYPGAEIRPLTMDELAVLPDVPANKEMPQHMADELARRRLYISHVEEDLTSAGRLRRLEDGMGEWELELPPGAVLGQLVQDTMVLEPSEQDRKDQGTTAGFRPDWIPMSYQPRLANKSSLRPSLRGVDGVVQPYLVFHPTTDRSTTRIPSLLSVSGGCSPGMTLPPTRGRTVGGLEHSWVRAM